MAKYLDSAQFASLFKKYRLRSEIDTLAEFGDFMAKEGMIYETSLFTHWQKGDRFPTNRLVLLCIIKIFSKRRGIVSVENANALLRSLGQRDITNEELSIFAKELSKTNHFSTPFEPEYFIGRENILKEVSWDLLNRDSILIHGIAGTGKTTLALKIAYIFKNRYRKRVLWYRYDIRKVDEILTDIIQFFGEPVSNRADKNIKSQVVKFFLAKEDVLIILDNVADFTDIHYLTPQNEAAYPLLLTSKSSLISIPYIKSVKLEGFTDIEVLDYSNQILGEIVTLDQKDKVETLSSLVGNSPLALSILLKQISTSKQNLSFYIDSLSKKKVNLSEFSYDTTNLQESLNISFSNLPDRLKKIFVTMGVFQGADFSIQSVAYINELSIKQALEYIKVLYGMGLIEYSIKRRYRLHPLVKIFIQNKVQPTLFAKLAKFYEQLFFTHGRGNSKNYQKVEIELENIYGILDKCKEYNLFHSISKLWYYFGLFLWDTGRWREVEKYGWLVVDASKVVGDSFVCASCLIDELSWLYYWYGDLSKSERCTKEGLSIAVALGNTELIALGSQRLGMVLQSKGKNIQARKLLEKSLREFKRLKKKDRIANTLLYIGHTYKNCNKLDNAKYYYHKSRTYAYKNPEHEAFAIALYYIGEVYLLRREYKQSEKYFQRALQTDTLRQRKPGIPWCLYGIGRVQYAYGNIEKALTLFKRAEELFTQLGITEQIQRVHNELNLINSLNDDSNKYSQSSIQWRTH